MQVLLQGGGVVGGGMGVRERRGEECNDVPDVITAEGQSCGAG